MNLTFEWASRNCRELPNLESEWSGSTKLAMLLRRMFQSVIVRNDYSARFGCDIANVVFCLDSNGVASPVQVTA